MTMPDLGRTSRTNAFIQRRYAPWLMRIVGRKTMALSETVQDLPKLGDELTIYARDPWRSSSEAKLAVEGSEEEKKAKLSGFRYFLEATIAREFLEDWSSTQKKAPTDEQASVRLIEYATNDV